MKRVLILTSLQFFINCIPVQCQDCPEFSIGNGLSFSRSNQILISKPTDFTDSFGKTRYSIFTIQKIETSQVTELPVSFNSINSTDYHPVFSTKNNYVIFISHRPEPGTMSPVSYTNLWKVYVTDTGYSSPQFLNINHKGHDSYPSVTEDHTLFFNSNRPGGMGEMDIYYSVFKKGKYQKPIPLLDINSEYSENDLVVHPEKDWIIFNRYFGKTGELDMFISFRNDKKWLNPQPLDIINSPDVYELTPTISPDLSTFYYEVNGTIKCIPLSKVINSVQKPKNFRK